jgi:hypothetical protein
VTDAREHSPLTPRAVLFAGVTILLAPLIYPIATGRLLTYDDLAGLHLPFRYLYQASLQNGEFLLSTPAYHAGFFLHGGGEAGMAHPLHLALYSWLPLGIAFNLEIIAAYLFLLAGMYRLWRTVGLSTEPAILGAMLSAFSSFTIYNVMHVNHISTLAHAPWLLVACHGVITGTRPAASFALAALVTGSQLLSGNPQYMWITLVAAVFWCAWHWSTRRRISSIAALGLAAILGIAIGAIQLLPSIEFFNDSVRVAWSREQSLSLSLSPVNLIQLWAPFAFRSRVFAPFEEQNPHEFIVYNGALCTLALAWIAIRWRVLTHRRLAVALLIFAGIGLWLAFGRYGGLYSLLAHLPVLRGLRASSRHIVLFQFALAGIAAIAAEDVLGLLRRRERVETRRLWPLAVPVVLAVVTVAIATTLAGSAWAADHHARFSTFGRAAAGSTAVVFAAILLAFSARGRVWAMAALPILGAVDLSVWGYSYVYRWGPPRSLAQLAESAEIPRDARPGDVIPADPSGTDYLAILRGLRLSNGNTGLYPRSQLELGDKMTELLEGIRWRRNQDGWEPVAEALPRARLLAKGRVISNLAADLRSLDVATESLTAEALDIGGTPGVVRMLVDRPGRIETETSSDGRQLLVLSSRYHSAWRATVDGSSAKPIAVYGDFLGLVVEPGIHHVTLEFAPASVRAGAQLSALGVLLTVAAAAGIVRTDLL